MIIWILAAVIIILLIGFLLWQNNSLTVDEYVVESPALPQSLDGCKIVQLSDLHNKSFGTDQKHLINAIKEAEPDIIFITGDLIDKHRTKSDKWGNALSLVRQAAELAPVFYVSGNHEWESGIYNKLRPQLETLGAEVIDNGFTVLDHGDAGMLVMGLSDQAAFSRNVKNGQKMSKSEMPFCIKKSEQRLEWLCGQEENAFQVLLAHRPQLLDMYATAGVHLVFCGHAHGGQVRLPWLGALYAPEQGWHPSYTEGSYIKDNTVMIVSRGLGNSEFPFRICNRPQVVAVTLKAAEENTSSEQEPFSDTLPEDFGDISGDMPGEMDGFVETPIQEEVYAEEPEVTPVEIFDEETEAAEQRSKEEAIAAANLSWEALESDNIEPDLFPAMDSLPEEEK